MESVYQLRVYREVGINGDDCRVLMFVEVKEFGGFDIGVHEKETVGVTFIEFIQLPELGL
jgi:hypothetical protein